MKPSCDPSKTGGTVPGVSVVGAGTWRFCGGRGHDLTRRSRRWRGGFGDSRRGSIRKRWPGGGPSRERRSAAKRHRALKRLCCTLRAGDTVLLPLASLRTQNHVPDRWLGARGLRRTGAELGGRNGREPSPSRVADSAESMSTEQVASGQSMSCFRANPKQNDSECGLASVSVEGIRYSFHYASLQDGEPCPRPVVGGG